MSDDTKAAWFLDGDLTPTSTLVERLRKPERVVVNEAGFTMLFSSSDKLDAADRIEKLEAALQIYSCDCSLASEEEDCELGDWTMLSCGYRARKALEGKDD